MRVTPIDNKARPFDYYGIRIWVKFQNSAMYIRNKRLTLVSELGMTEEEYDKQTDEFKGSILGRAFIGTIVTDIEPFNVTEPDGTVIHFEFDKKSEVDGYETMAEELLGMDSALRDEVLTYSVNMDHYRESREVEALGNSKEPSASGG